MGWELSDRSADRSLPLTARLAVARWVRGLPAVGIVAAHGAAPLSFLFGRDFGAFAGEGPVFVENKFVFALGARYVVHL